MKKTILLVAVIAATALVATAIVLFVGIQFQQQQPNNTAGGLANMPQTKEIQTPFSCLPEDKNEEEVAGFIQLIHSTKTANENIKKFEAQRKVVFDSNDPVAIADWNATAGDILEGYYKIRREHPELAEAASTLSEYSDEELREMFMYKNENDCKDECNKSQLDYKSASCDNGKLNCFCIEKVI